MKITQLLIFCISIATKGYAGDDKFFLDLNHFGHPSERPLDIYGKPIGKDDCDINITNCPFPKDKQNIITNASGYSFVPYFSGNNHSYFSTLFINTPSGNSSKISIGQYYWSDRDLSLRWVSENLLFMRIWWGRHWGDDYIYNADTQKIIYSDGFDEPKELPGKNGLRPKLP